MKFCAEADGAIVKSSLHLDRSKLSGHRNNHRTISIDSSHILVAKVHPKPASGGPPTKIQLQLFGLADVVPWSFFSNRNLGFSKNAGFWPIIVAQYRR